MPSPILTRYLPALNRYKWPALATGLGVLGLSAVVAMQPPPEPIYRAEGTLVLNAPVVALTATGTEVQQRGQGIISEQFLLADVLLEQVSQELARQGIEMAPEALREATRVRLEGTEEENQVQQVTVVFRDTDSEQAQVIANLLVESMVELSRVANRSRLRAIITALDERLPDAELALRQAEQALEAYDRIEGPAIQAALDGSLLGAISGGQQQQRQNQLTLAGLESQIQSLQRQLGLTPGQALTSSALSADPIIAQLRAQILETETQLKLQSANLREAHPTMQELQKNLAAYNTLLAERAAEVIGGGDLAALPSVSQIRQNSTLDPTRAALANQLVVLTNERDALLQQQQILVQADGQLRQQYASLPNKQLERDRLAQQVALNQALYDQIQARRIDAEAAEAETVSSLIVAQPPVVNPVEQSATNPALIMALGSLLGAIAAGAVIFLLDTLDGTLRTSRDIETLFEEQDVPVLGLIPTLPSAAHHQHSALLLAQSPYLPAYEDLRTKLRRSPALSSEREPKLVLVTSNWAQEGKTTTALNLAIASARAGRRTLIIEADVQQPSQTLWLGLTLPPEATREPRRYYAGHFGDPIQLVPQVEHLYLAPSPGPQLHGAAVLESSEMKQFLIDARARFDLVLLDGPPLSRNTQSLALANQTDGLLLVARPGYAEKAGLETLLEDLLDTEDLVVLGAVVNAADATITTPVERVQVPTSPASPVLSSPAAPARPVDFF